MTTISILSPVKNEEKNINFFLENLIIELKKIKKINFQLIFVNDGSKDKTELFILKKKRSYKDIKLISLIKSYGKDNAIYAGLNYVKKINKSSAVIIIDGDGEHPVKEIKNLISLWIDGYKIITTSKDNNYRKISLKHIIRNIYVKINKIFFNENNLFISDFSLIDKTILNELLQHQKVNFSYSQELLNYSEISKNLNISIESINKKKSNFSFNQLVKIAIKRIIIFSSKPLIVVAIIGLISFLLSLLLFLFMLITLLLSIYDYKISTFFIVLNTILSSSIIFFLGVISTYIKIIKDSVYKSPNYIIKDIK